MGKNGTLRTAAINSRRVINLCLRCERPDCVDECPDYERLVDSVYDKMVVMLNNEDTQIITALINGVRSGALEALDAERVKNPQPLYKYEVRSLLHCTHSGATAIFSRYATPIRPGGKRYLLPSKLKELLTDVKSRYLEGDEIGQDEDTE